MSCTLRPVGGTWACEACPDGLCAFGQRVTRDRATARKAGWLVLHWDRGMTIDAPGIELAVTEVRDGSVRRRRYLPDGTTRTSLR